jgi:glycosyltransferase involved in cell wall biosynthesis
MNKLITLVVSTRNRVHDLPDLFDSLRENDGDLFELLVVDQSTNEDSKRYIEEYLKKYPDFDLRLVTTDTKGLSISRNIGIANAKYDVILFTDDDCVIDKNFISNVAKVFEDSEVQAYCGRVEPYIAEGTVMPKNYEPVACVLRKEKKIFSELHSNDFFTIGSGNNMAYRKKLFEKIGVFEPKLGAGGKLKSAEDIEFFYRILKNRISITYSPDPFVYHKQWRRTSTLISTSYMYFFGIGAVLWEKALRGDEEVKPIIRKVFTKGLMFMKSGVRKFKPMRILVVLVQFVAFLHAKFYIFRNKGY